MFASDPYIYPKFQLNWVSKSQRKCAIIMLKKLCCYWEGLILKVKIKNARCSDDIYIYIFKNNERWKKKTRSCFNVTMGCFDGAQVCDLIGIYILSLLTSFICQNDIGLYRDNGLIVLHKLNGKQIDQMRKKITQCFKSVGFKIEIQTNLTGRLLRRHIQLVRRHVSAVQKTQGENIIYPYLFEPSAWNIKTTTNLN